MLKQTITSTQISLGWPPDPKSCTKMCLFCETKAISHMPIAQDADQLAGPCYQFMFRTKAMLLVYNKAYSSHIHIYIYR